MGKRTFMLRMTMVGVAVFALLFGAPALADTTTCILKDSLGRGNATLTAVPGTKGEWPVFVAASTGVPESWEYRYLLSSPSSGAIPVLGVGTSVDFLIPTCTPPLTINGTGVTVYPAGNPPGAGSRFGSWTGHDNVVRVVKAVSGSSNIVFSTPKLLPIHDVSAGLATGTTTSSYLCKDIVAPVCPGAPGQAFQPATLNTCGQIEGKWVFIERNANHCITDIWDCGSNEGCPITDGAKCHIVLENVEVKVTCVDGETCSPGDGFAAGDITGNQICPEAFLFSASSPGCTNIPKAGGGFTQICR
jgi:hypothetical protein